jgi:hypothetical protein
MDRLGVGALEGLDETVAGIWTGGPDGCAVEQAATSEATTIIALTTEREACITVPHRAILGEPLDYETRRGARCVAAGRRPLGG